MKKTLAVASIALALVLGITSPALAAKGGGKGDEGSKTTSNSYDGPMVYCDGNGDGTFTERWSTRSQLEFIRTPDDINYFYAVYNADRTINHYVTSQNLTTYYGSTPGTTVIGNHCVIP